MEHHTKVIEKQDAEVKEQRARSLGHVGASAFADNDRMNKCMLTFHQNL